MDPRRRATNKEQPNHHVSLVSRLFHTKSLRSWFYPTASIDDVFNPVFWRDVFIEAVICAYILAAVIWTLQTLNTHMYVPTTTHFGLFAGFFVFVVIEGFAPLCGAPINPVGCWGFFLAGRISLARAFFYTLAEVGGAAVGSEIAAGLSAEGQVFHPLKPGQGLSPLKGMAIEAILTFNLIVVALSCTDTKNRPSINLPALPIAFCIGTGIMAAGTHTGGLQNPIVPFGPALVAKDFEHHWIYWVGPYIGATVGSLFYQTMIYIKHHFDHPHHHEEEHQGLHNDDINDVHL